jgi:hypothetical protein
MDRHSRVLAFVGVVAVCATVAGAVAGRLLPALGVPDLYGTAVTSAVGAVVIASFWVLLGDGFVAAGPRLVATATGVFAGVYVFYRRNRTRFAR